MITQLVGQQESEQILLKYEDFLRFSPYIIVNLISFGVSAFGWTKKVIFRHRLGNCDGRSIFRHFIA